VQRNAGLLAVSLWALACDATRDSRNESPAGSVVQPGSSAISDVLDVTGACMRREADWWTYTAKAPTGVRVSVTRHPNAPRQFAVVITEATGEMPLGIIDLSKQTVSWSDLRDPGADGVEKRDGRTAHAPSHSEQARTEWTTPRGQLLVALILKADSTCVRREK